MRKVILGQVAALLLLSALSWCGAAESGDVGFADANLEAAIREALAVQPTDPLSLETLRSLTSLDARRREIASLAGIEQCAELRELTLWGNRIADLAPLAGLANLRYLDLDENQASDLRPLAGLTRLEILFVSMNGVRDLAPLSSLSALVSLSAWGNEIRSLTPLTGLRQLEQLDASWNEITDAGPVAQLTGLTVLDLSANPLRDTSPIASLTRLGYLGLAGTGLRDIGWLAGFAAQGFCYLDLSDNSISSVAPLAGFAMGTCARTPRLDLSKNRITSLAPLGDLEAPGGCLLDVRGNPLGESGAGSQDDEIAALLARGITVLALSPLEVGDAAPDFELPRLGSEETLKRSDLLGRVMILDFWASWCGPCRATMPSIDALAATFPQDVVFLAVCLDRDVADAVAYLEATPVSHGIVLYGGFDPANAVSLAFGDLLVNGIPHTFVIDRRGTIRYSGHPGELTEDLLRELVRQP